MKRNIFYILSLILLPMMVMGQFQEVNVPFSDMSKRGKLVVNVKMGPVTVVGTGRQDVLVKYKSGEGKELGFEEAKGGLKRISGGFAGIEITEKNNEVYVGSQSWTKSIVLEIEVPQDIDIKLDAHNFGDINVDNIKGEVAIKSFNGSINAENISGSLVASTYAGGLKASFNSVTPDTPLSFTCYAGDIDITLPASVKASFKMHTEMGEIFTGFDMDLKQPEIKQSKGKNNTVLRTFVDEWITGKVNGGGPEVTVKNFS